MKAILRLGCACLCLVSCGNEVLGVKMCQESKWAVTLPMSFRVEGGIDRSELDKAVSFWNGYFGMVVFKENIKGESVIRLEDIEGKVLGTSQSWTTEGVADYFVVRIDRNKSQTIAHELGHALGLSHVDGLMGPTANDSLKVECTGKNGG